MSRREEAWNSICHMIHVRVRHDFDRSDKAHVSANGIVFPAILLSLLSWERALSEGASGILVMSVSSSSQGSRTKLPPPQT
jgi:hypothetical protein